jgi:hypothetical protein
MIKHISVVIVVMKLAECVISIGNKLTIRILSESQSVLNDTVL